MIVLKRIVVATDFGEAAGVALDYGRELARTFGAGLDVVHVADNLASRGFGSDGFAVDFSDVQTALEAAAQRQLEAVVDEEDRSMLKARTVLLKSGSPALAIVQYAKESQADLILMGTHGRSGIGHLLMGSVAERVVRTAPCPVLTVRHPERDFMVPDALVAVTTA